jgi:protein bicaudal C
MQRTKTTILFPDAGDPNIPPIRKGSVTITGAIHNVYSARQQLVGSMPLVMMFDMPDGIDVIDTDVQKIGEELDVALSIKPKHRQSNKSVLIKAQERNASAIYAARHRLLHVDEDEESLVVADIPETYKIQPISAQMMAGLGITFVIIVFSTTAQYFKCFWRSNDMNGYTTHVIVYTSC